MEKPPKPEKELEVKGILIPNDPSKPEYWSFWREVTDLSEDG